MSFAISQWLFVLTCSAYLINRWLTRRSRKLMRQFPGPPSIPIIGHLGMVLKPRHKILQAVEAKLMTHSSPVGLWFFNTPVLFIYDHENMQVVLGKLMTKGWMFAFLQRIWGDGLASTEDPETWKLHKRVIYPVFNNLKTMGKRYLEICQDMEQKLIQDLDVFADTEQHVDISQMVYYRDTRRTFHTLTGFQTEHMEKKYQFDFNDFVKNMRANMIHLMRRVFLPWLHPDVINSIYEYLSGACKENKKVREILKKIVRDRDELTKNGQDNANDSQNAKHGKVLLDVLLDPESPAKYNYDACVDEILTFFEAGSNPIPQNVCWTLLMLAMNPELQDRAYEEIKQVFGDREDIKEVEEFSRLVFLEQCIKETLRLFPPAPFLMRSDREELTLKAGTMIILSLMFLHRNEAIYSNPETWDPSRFLPEEISKRPAQSFLPFSVGQHTCFGGRYAYLSIKSELVALLQKYRFKTHLKMCDIELIHDPIIRSLKGYPLSIYRRK